MLRLTRPVVEFGAPSAAPPAFWKWPRARGCARAVVNWLDDVAGARGRGRTVITERATLRLERGGPPEGELGAAADLRRTAGQVAGRSPTARAPAGTRAADGLAPSDRRRSSLRATQLDATQVGLALAIDPAPLDLLAVYLPGLDIAQGALVKGASPAPSVLSDRLRGTEQVYVALDQSIAPPHDVTPGPRRRPRHPPWTLRHQPTRDVRESRGFRRNAGRSSGGRKGLDGVAAPTWRRRCWRCSACR